MAVESPVRMPDPSVAPAPPGGQKRPRMLVGVLWMLVFCLGFAIIGIMVRFAAPEMHPFEIAFFRNLIVLAIMIPIFARAGIETLRTKRVGTHVWRAIAGVATMSCMFTAMAMLPLAEVTTLTFTAPLFVTVGAALFLGEVVRARRWTATAIGFIGVLIVLRPGVEILSPGALWALATSLGMATSALFIKSLARTESAMVIVFYMALFMTPLSLIPAVFVWSWPGPETFAYVGVLGVTATVSQFAFAKAMRIAEASAMMPVDFTRLIFAAVLGYLIFAEVPDAWTWLGAGVILGSTVYIAHRESRRARDGEATK